MKMDCYWVLLNQTTKDPSPSFLFWSSGNTGIDIPTHSLVPILATMECDGYVIILEASWWVVQICGKIQLGEDPCQVDKSLVGCY